MLSDARASIRRSWVRRLWIRRLGAACCGGVLACVVCLAPAPCAAQSYLQVYSQAVILGSCLEGVCECSDNGVPETCPASHERYYDSGPIFGDPGFDTHWEADVLAKYDPTTLLGSETRLQVQLNASASYGRLRGWGWTRAFATGEVIEAGGFAYGGDARATLGASLSDDLTLIGAVPGGPVSIRLRQEIGGPDFVLIRGSDNYPVTNFCLANGDATTSLSTVLSTTHLGIGGGDQSVGYLRRTNECSAPVVTGDPLSFIVIDGHGGDFVHVGQTLSIESYAYMGGGNGLPNRVTYANSWVDASNTAEVFVDVLTPGASFTSASGATYQVPESSGPAGQLAALLVVLGLRRSVGPRTQRS
jgi:hypothetical protein